MLLVRETDRRQPSRLNGQYFHLREADPGFDSRPGDRLVCLLLKYLQTMAIDTVSVVSSTHTHSYPFIRCYVTDVRDKTSLNQWRKNAQKMSHVLAAFSVIFGLRRMRTEL